MDTRRWLGDSRATSVLLVINHFEFDGNHKILTLTQICETFRSSHKKNLSFFQLCRAYWVRLDVTVMASALDILVHVKDSMIRIL